MPIFNNIIILLWISFAVYWLVSAIGVKRNIKGDRWKRTAGIRILVTVAVVLLLQASLFWQSFAYRFDFGVQLAGVILCVAGIVIAIWARVHLGRNWSGTPSMKEGHEFVTSGPYSALVAGVIWLVMFFFFTANFLYRIPVEERYMMQLFPDQYPAYKKRTKALIPFVW
jgi:protein-S-isoprenylcysteine O-methyltransferase Ste14